MPVYEYICQKCAGEFEKRLSFSEADQPQDCPACGHQNNKKKLSLFASSVIGGSTVTSSSSAGCGGGGGFT